LFSNGGHLGSAFLALLNFPKPSKPLKLIKKMIKINRLTRKRSKNVKIIFKKVMTLLLKKGKFKILKKQLVKKWLPWQRQT